MRRFLLVFLSLTLMIFILFSPEPVFADYYEFKFEFGGTGAGEGQFNEPKAISVNISDYLYVADTRNDRVQIFKKDGEFFTTFGERGFDRGQFCHPSGIALNETGFLYVSDTNNDIIQIFNPDCQYVSSFGETGSDPGQFRSPQGITINSTDSVYVAGGGRNRIQVFNRTGGVLYEWGSAGADVGKFQNPSGIALNSSGNVYVTDCENSRIQVLNESGNFLKTWGSAGADAGQFSQPKGICINSTDHVFVADTGNNRVQIFDPDGVYLSQIPHLAYDIIVNSSGYLYLTDTENDKIVVYGPPPPLIDTIDPDREFNNKTVLISVTGQNFRPNPEVLLISGTGREISPVQTTYESSTQIGVMFDLMQEEAGEHTLLVRYPDLQEGNALFQVLNPVPAALGITPDSGVNTSAHQRVLVYGSDLVENCVVNLTKDAFTLEAENYDYSKVPTGFTCVLNLTKAEPGIYDIVVKNPEPGGGTLTLSNIFTVLKPAPQIVSFSPDTVQSGSGRLNVLIQGNGDFREGAAVKFCHDNFQSIILERLNVTPFCISGSFETFLMAPGFWDVVLETPESESAVFQDAINVTSSGQPLLSVSSDSDVLSPQCSEVFEIKAENLVSGLYRYQLSVEIQPEGAGVITGTEYPDWVCKPYTQSFPAGSVWLTGSDCFDRIGSGNASLGSVTVMSLTPDDFLLIAKLTSMTDENGGMYESNEVRGAIRGSTQNFQTFPNGYNPKDTTGDRLYNDVDGNNIFNFRDVVFFFKNIELAEQSEMSEKFDFDRSGTLNLNDVVKFFRMAEL